MAEAAKLRTAMARGIQAAQQVLVPGNRGDVGQSGAEATHPVDAAGDAGRGGADYAAWPVVEEGSGGGAQERPAGQAEVETLVPEPPRAGVEGVVEESA